jgi:hypothetical protein
MNITNVNFKRLVVNNSSYSLINLTYGRIAHVMDYISPRNMIAKNVMGIMYIPHLSTKEQTAIYRQVRKQVDFIWCRTNE